MAQVFVEAGLALVFAIVAFTKCCFRRLNPSDAGGAAGGEPAVRRLLDELPDEFRVEHDVATPFGNIDHVVVGPTGVFILETKVWRGIVAADGNGELMLNGKPLDQPHVRDFLGQVTGVKEKVRVLASSLDPYFQAVFVFPSARVEARFGTTSSLHCIGNQQLFDYIVNKRFGKRLPPVEVETIAQAFLGLADMESRFSDEAAPVRPAPGRHEFRPLAPKHRAENHRLIAASA